MSIAPGDGQVQPIGVVGLGVVGGTVRRAFEEAGTPVRGYDRYLEIGRPYDLSECSVVFMCVSTPAGEQGSHDLSELFSATREVETHLERGTVIAIKSTSPPGTCDRLAADFPDLRFVSFPEFLVATNPMETFRRPDRVVIGSHSAEAATAVAELMARVAPEAPVIVLTPIEAELVKLCSNAMLAAKVTMANELAEICSRLGVSWARVQGVVGLDRRIAPSHMTVTAERGFGGACLPKDLDALIAASKAAGYLPSVLEGISEFNSRVREEATRQPWPPATTGSRDDGHG